MGYELAPNVVTSEELERVLAPVFQSLGIGKGTIESLTGVRERRWWDREHAMSEKATLAAQKALKLSSIDINDIGMLIYGGVCRDFLEPATACVVADNLNIPKEAMVYDVSNACLGVLNGMVQIASAIELGHIKAGMVVSCESSRQIMELTIGRLLKNPDMELFKNSLATMTGGSGAVAFILTGKTSDVNHRLIGATIRNATEYNHLCRWGPDTGIPATQPTVMQTDAVGVLQNGVALGLNTFRVFTDELDLVPGQPNKVVLHQVGKTHHETILRSLEIVKDRDFATYEVLGNMGTVSLPITAAIADKQGFFKKGESVGLLGIGSGLNCLLIGLEW